MCRSSTPQVPVVVIGGGIAGLTVSWELARAGVPVLLLEASSETGGVLRAHTVGGLVLDAGAESFATRNNTIPDLLDTLGLSDRVVRPEPRGAWVRFDDRDAPLPVGGVLGVPGRPWAADVRRVLGSAGSARAALDALLPRRVGASATTLGPLVRARMGGRVVRRLVEPVAGGVYAADPDGLDIATVAPALAVGRRGHGLGAAVRGARGPGAAPGSAVGSLVGGMHTLAAALTGAVEAAGGTVRTGAKVVALRRAEPASVRQADAARLSAAQHSAGWHVEVAGTTPVPAAQVVLAVPGAAAAELLELDGTPVADGAILRQPGTAVRLCTLVLDDARLDAAPRGSGVLVARAATGVTAKALTHATAKWRWLAETAGPSRHVLRLSYGRGTRYAADPVAADGAAVANPADAISDAELPDVALRDAGTLLGLELSATALVDTAVATWRSALPTPRPGHAPAVERLRATVGRQGVSIVGSSVAGTGLAAVVADARVQAARITAEPDDAAHQ